MSDDGLYLIANELMRLADAVTRLAVVAERAVPPTPDRTTVTPAGATALTRPSLQELAQWEHDDRRGPLFQP